MEGDLLSYWKQIFNLKLRAYIRCQTVEMSNKTALYYVDDMTLDKCNKLYLAMHLKSASLERAIKREMGERRMRRDAEAA